MRPGSELRLGPEGDTGVSLGERRARPRRRRLTRDPWLAPLIVVLAAFLLAAVALANPGTAKLIKVTPSTAARPLGEAVGSRLAKPTPVFATYGSLRIHLPVPAEAVTTIAFHQASFTHAVSMVSLVPEMGVGATRAAATLLRTSKGSTATPGPTSSASSTPPVQPGTDIWSGHVVRLWRSGRGGKPDTAADVGAPPGTPVVSPVDGTVVYVRPYKLYGKYGDYEVHISPKDDAGVDVVLIHITDVCVAAGDSVQAGVTQIACVRRLSGLFGMQLAQYTADGGDHTHLQLNRLAGPGKIWVSLPGGPVAVPFATGAASSTPTPTVAP